MTARLMHTKKFFGAFLSYSGHFSSGQIRTVSESAASKNRTKERLGSMRDTANVPQMPICLTKAGKSCPVWPTPDRILIPESEFISRAVKPRP